ncbi:Ig-like domain-containing protein [Hyalangium rubrum]|uniref:Ig-like domain-containing protein n=1 Tax=Hyalangium rubrum TaxID=3103134 RepID=A0ABU5HB17_9BACT|nr:Ig-like domain-containing protein [Hyalangium sp. s54d21]MDY7230069.1 Ig-like domain-containing protein [Hyalangium sp. s54d21]
MNRNRASSFAVMLFLAASGCISLPGIDPVETPDAGNPNPDGGLPDESLPDLSVRVLAPAGTTYTNGVVDVSVEVTSGTPDVVELLVGDELLATLTAPYTFRWDTTTKAEGNYALVARARRAAQTFTSAARNVVVDRTPPQVVIRTPEPGAEGVSASRPVQVAFSEPLDPSSVNSTSVRMSVNGADIATNVTLSADAQLFQVAPSMRMGLPAEVDLNLTSGLRDLAGNALQVPQDVWNWSVPDFYFIGSVPQVPSMVAGQPSLQLDAAGMPLVAYVVGGYGYVRRWTGSEWEQLGGSLNVTSGSTLASPLLQMTGNGEIVIAWSETKTVRYIYVKRWTGSNWESVGTALSASPGSAISSLSSLRMDGSGNPVVAFSADDGSTLNLQVWRWSGTTWASVGNALSAKPGNTPVRDVSLRLDSADSPVVSWTEMGDDSFEALYVSRWNAEEWEMLGGPISVNPGMTPVHRTSLALDSAGQPVVSFQESSGSRGGLYVHRWTGSQWTALGGNLNVSSIVVDVNSLQLDSEGRAVVAWTGGSDVFDVHIGRWTGAGWEMLGGALSAKPGSYTSAYGLSLQLNADGFPVIAWSESEVVGGGIYVARFNY